MTTDDDTIDHLLDRYDLTSVPTTLREQEGVWVCWRYEERERADGDTYETKVPLKPFNSSHPYAKPNDPDTWGEFADAVHFHADPSTDTAGIGFMFAREGVVLGVDLDDVRYVDDDGTEHIEPVAQELIDRFDSYAELSPTGTGYHILTLGILPERGGNKTGLERTLDVLERELDEPVPDHVAGPDLELYDNRRFFTVTGDHVAETPTTIEQRNDVVADVVDEYLVDDADDDENESLDSFDGDTGAASRDEPGIEVTLNDRQLVERASDAKNGQKFHRLYRGDTSGYPSHSEADLAFCNMLAFWTQRDARQMDSIFRSSGLMRPKWDEARGGETYGEMTIQEAIRKCDEIYDPSPDRDDPDPPDPDDFDPDDVVTLPDDDSDDAEEEDAAADGGTGGGNGGGGGGGGDGDGPDGGDDDDDEIPKPGPTASFVESAGRYGVMKVDQSGDSYFEQWTNFQIEVDSFLMVDGEARRYDLTIHPATNEDAYTVMATPDDFADRRRFCENIACGFSTTFDGSLDALSRLKEFVAAQPARYGTGTQYIGRHGDEFVFPDGTLTADGWTRSPETVFVPPGREEAAGSLGEMCQLDPSVGDEPDVDEAGAVAELLPQLHDPERFLPVLGWYYAVPFRPFIYDWTGQFNYLSLTGETGSGKTRTTGLVNKAFGMDETPLSAADTTPFSVMVTFASSNAVPVWYDEWKPSDMSDSDIKEFKSHLRQTTTEGTPQRGNREGGVTGQTMKAPLVVGGEERVRGSAEERRGIFTQYPKGVTDPANGYRPVYEELKGTVTNPGRDLTQHALAYYQFALDLPRDEVRNLWMAAGRYVETFCADHGIRGLEDLVEQGMATVRFGLMLHNRFCDWLGVENPLTSAQVDTALEYIATDSAGGTNRQTHADEYLSLIARAAMNEDLVRDKHYTFVYTDDDEKPTELRFKPDATYDLVKLYAERHGAANDLLGDADDYRNRFRDQLYGGGETYVTCVGETTYPMNKRLDGVALAQVEATVDGFDRSMFDAPELPSRQADAGSGDDDGDADTAGGTPVTALEPEQGYTTTTVRVPRVEYPDSASIALTATGTDSTGAIDIVQWGGEVPDIEDGETYRLERVAVQRDQDGATQLVIEPGVTTLTHVSDAERDDARDENSSASGDPSPDDPDAADDPAADGSTTPGVTTVPDVDPGEYDDARADVIRVLRDRGPLSKSALAGAIDRPPEKVAHATDRLKESGRVTELPDGTLSCE